MLALVADPLELAPGQPVTIQPWNYLPPGSTVVEQRWTFCPVSAGAVAAYACAVPQCEVDVPASPDGSVTANPTAILLQCLGIGGGVLPPSVPDQLLTVFRYRIATDARDSRDAVLQIPQWTRRAPTDPNLPPVILGVEIGGQPAQVGVPTPPLPVDGLLARAPPHRPGQRPDLRRRGRGHPDRDDDRLLLHDRRDLQRGHHHRHGHDERISRAPACSPASPRPRSGWSPSTCGAARRWPAPSPFRWARSRRESAMANVRIYSKEQCPYCVRAKALLDRKGIAYEEIDAEHDDALRAWLVEATGQRTVPQIFVGDRSLGGFSDIDALDRQGKLDAILRGEG